MIVSTRISNGRKYNSTSANQEATKALRLAAPRIGILQKQGILPRHIERLAALRSLLPELDRTQSTTRQAAQATTDRVNALLDEGRTAIGALYNLAWNALHAVNPAALESLPSRGISWTVSNVKKALNDGAGFVRTHPEAFVVEEAPAFDRHLDGLAEALTIANTAQQDAIGAAEAASRALFEARGEIRELAGSIYQAGRTAYRREPELKAEFAYEYMITHSATSSGEETNPSDESAKKAAEEKKKAAAEAKKAAEEAKKATAEEARKASAEAKKSAGDPKKSTESAQSPAGSPKNPESSRSEAGSTPNQSANATPDATAAATPTAVAARSIGSSAAAENGGAESAPLASTVSSAVAAATPAPAPVAAAA